MHLEKLNNQNTIIIIGRAHIGTRIIPDVLKASGIYINKNFYRRRYKFIRKAMDLLNYE